MVKFRLYYDKDKEEIWLNEMASQGWAMVKFFCGFYWFESCSRGEYIYQIDLFTEPKSNMTQSEYIELVKETGAEYMGRWFWWRFFRRRSELGEFKLYTDSASQLEQYQRMFRFFRNILIAEMMILCYDSTVTTVYMVQKIWSGLPTMFLCCIMMTMMTVGIGKVCCGMRKKIRALEQELM